MRLSEIYDRIALEFINYNLSVRYKYDRKHSLMFFTLKKHIKGRVWGTVELCIEDENAFTYLKNIDYYIARIIYRFNLYEKLNGA